MFGNGAGVEDVSERRVSRLRGWILTGRKPVHGSGSSNISRMPCRHAQTQAETQTLDLSSFAAQWRTPLESLQRSEC